MREKKRKKERGRERRRDKKLRERDKREEINEYFIETHFQRVIRFDCEQRGKPPSIFLLFRDSIKVPGLEKATAEALGLGWAVVTAP